MSRCIYCNRETKLSEEHYLPACLGEFQGFESLYDRLCAECNNKLSTCEEQFCRSGPEAVFRTIYGIKGRKYHEKPNPFYRGSAGAPPLVLKAQLPGETFDILWELQPGTREVRELRQLVLFLDDGSSECIPIPDWMNEPDQLQNRVKAAIGERIVTSGRIFGATEEIPKLEPLVAGWSSGIDWSANEPSVVKRSVFRVEVTDKYFRAVCKIGFHYFLKYIDVFTGAEECFAGIKSFIMSGGNQSEFVSWDTRPVVANVAMGERPIAPCHVLTAEADEFSLRAAMQFFLGPEYLPWVYRVRLGLNPYRVLPSIKRGHSFHYFQDGKQGDYDGIMKVSVPVNLVSPFGVSGR